MRPSAYRRNPRTYTVARTICNVANGMTSLPKRPEPVRPLHLYETPGRSKQMRFPRRLEVRPPRGKRPLCRLDRTHYGFLTDGQVGDLFRRLVVHRPSFLVNSAELSSMVHLPPAESLQRRRAPALVVSGPPVSPDALTHGTPIGFTHRSGSKRLIHIPPDLRRFHTHVIGSTGCGKSSLLGNMILSDVQRGDGVAVFDPHGDLIEWLLHELPESAIERTIHRSR